VLANVDLIGIDAEWCVVINNIPRSPTIERPERQRKLPVKLYERINLERELPEMAMKLAWVDRVLLLHGLEPDAGFLDEVIDDVLEIVERAQEVVEAFTGRSLLMGAFLATALTRLGRIEIKTGRGNKPRPEVEMVRGFVSRYVDWPLTYLMYATGRSKSTVAEIVATGRQQLSEVIQATPESDAVGRRDDPASAYPNVGIEHWVEVLPEVFDLERDLTVPRRVAFETFKHAKPGSGPNASGGNGRFWPPVEWDFFESTPHADPRWRYPKTKTTATPEEALPHDRDAVAEPDQAPPPHRAPRRARRGATRVRVPDRA
jgi:hypothetical protein